MKRIVYVGAGVLCWMSVLRFAGPDATQAAAIYSQITPSQPIGAFTSTDALDYPKIADNFLLDVAQPTTIRSVRFIGGYIATMPPPITPPLNALPTDNFRVVFLADAGGSPGVPVSGGDFTLGAAARRNPTGAALLNGNQFPIEYALDLADGITLVPNTVYWISILNYPGPLYGWSWARATGVFDQQLAGTEGNMAAGPWAVYTAGGMFFALDDTNIPEPGSSTIFMIGLLVLVGIRVALVRRRPRCV
jgi:hypothetical protein